MQNAFSFKQDFYTLVIRNTFFFQLFWIDFFIFIVLSSPIICQFCIFSFYLHYSHLNFFFVVFRFLLFPFSWYYFFSRTLNTHPLSFAVLLPSSEKRKGGVYWGRGWGCTDWKGLCVCVSMLCFTRSAQHWVCLPACLHCCCFLCGLPANFMIYSAKGRGARPPVTTERAPHVGLMISPQKCLLWLGPLFQGQREREQERESHTVQHRSHPLGDGFAPVLGSIPNMDIMRK